MKKELETKEEPVKLEIQKITDIINIKKEELHFFEELQRLQKDINRLYNNKAFSIKCRIPPYNYLQDLIAGNRFSVYFRNDNKVGYYSNNGSENDRYWWYGKEPVHVKGPNEVIFDHYEVFTVAGSNLSDVSKKEKLDKMFSDFLGV